MGKFQVLEGEQLFASGNHFGRQLQFHRIMYGEDLYSSLVVSYF